MENLLDHANDTEGTTKVKMIEMDVKRRNIPISYCQKLSATRNVTYVLPFCSVYLNQTKRQLRFLLIFFDQVISINLG